MKNLKSFESYNPEGDYIEQDDKHLTSEEELLNSITTYMKGKTYRVSADEMNLIDKNGDECEVHTIEEDGITTDIGFLGYDELSGDALHQIKYYITK